MTYDGLTDEHKDLVEATLTDLQLEVFKARMDRHPWQRIANAMNLDEATVRGHHKRAIRRLNNARKEAA